MAKWTDEEFFEGVLKGAMQIAIGYQRGKKTLEELEEYRNSTLDIIMFRLKEGK